MALAQVVAAEETERLRVCEAPDCEAVLVDLSRNRSKRYCDARTCGNRLNVAAYRQRKRSSSCRSTRPEVADFEVIRRHRRCPADEAWRRLTDWERHGDFIPFTRGAERADPRRGGRDLRRPARRRAAATSTTRWRSPSGSRRSDDEPGVCRIVKRGRVVTGWAVLTITPDGDGRDHALARGRRLPGRRQPAQLANRVAGRRIFGRLVDGLLDDKH